MKNYKILTALCAITMTVNAVPSKKKNIQDSATLSHLKVKKSFKKTEQQQTPYLTVGTGSVQGDIKAVVQSLNVFRSTRLLVNFLINNK